MKVYLGNLGCWSCDIFN